MKGIILVNAYSESEEYLYQAKRLKEEFALLSVEADIVKNNSFPFIIENNSISSAIRDYDFCIYWDKDKYILSMLEKTGIPVFNSKEAILSCDDKMQTYIELADKGIPLPKTLPGLLCYREEERLLPSAVDEVERQLGYPLVIKESYGSLGGGVYLARSRNELLEYMERVKCREHLFQEFINASYGKDLRIIVIGDEVIGGMLREGNGDFRSNIASGGSAKPFELSDDLKELALNISEALKLDYCGIDILFSETGPVVCEVNSNAFFHTFEKTTNINVAKKYAHYVIKKINAPGL